MLRQPLADGRGRLAAVLEPYGTKPRSRVNQRIDAPGAALALKLVDGELVDFVAADGHSIVRLAEASGLAFDPVRGRLRFTAFPQRKHRGRARVEWFR